MTERSPRLIRLKEVLHLVPLGRSTIYERMNAGTFPKCIDLGGNVVAWRETEVLAWIAGREAGVAIEQLEDRAEAQRVARDSGLFTSAPSHGDQILTVDELYKGLIRIKDIGLGGCGLYFLWRANRIVYVGQTKNGILRLATHISDPKKSFDGVSFIRCPSEQLAVAERAYIDAFLPEYNIDAITAAARRRSTKGANIE